MAQTPQKPAPKIEATKTRPLTQGADHDERVIDESLDESFPASDPASIASPDGTLAVKQAAQDGRKTPEPDTSKKSK